jgi:dipeptidyl aminopeptidase/acylaminoacyl peptidase
LCCMLEDYDVLRFYSYRQANTPRPVGDSTVYFVSDMSGRPELWFTRIDHPFPVQLTFLEGYASAIRVWGDRLLFQFDPNGSEEHRIMCVDAEGNVSSPLAEQGDHVVHRIGDTAQDGQFSFASNSRSTAFFDSYVYRDGAVHLVFQCDGTSQAHGFSPDSRRLLVTVSTSNLNNDVYVVDLDTKNSVKLFDHADEALTVEPTWADDGYIYACTNLDNEFMQPVAIEPATGKVHWLARDRWDADHIAVSKDGYVAYTRNHDGYSEIHILGPDRRELHTRLFEGTVDELVFHNNTLFFTYSGWDTNTNILMLQVASLSLGRLTNASRGYLGPAVKPTLEYYESFDELRVPVFVYTPNTHGYNPPYPTVVYVHGGPESQKRVEYDGQIQFFLHQGYAVVTPNVRGSTGYGKTYTHLDDVRRRLDSVKDLAWLAKWIQRDNRFDASRLCVMGRSYGGYMVLAALAFYPELWRCGVEAVGIASLETFLRNTSTWRRKLREAEYGSLELDLDFLREASPLNHAHRIRAPLLIQHGSNDPRVPISESKAIVDTIRAQGGVAELVVFEDEGHMIQSVHNRLKWATILRDFLKKYL